MPAFIPFLIAALFVTGAGALVFWNRIRHMAETSLLPWVEQNIPQVSELVRKAYIAVDNVVAPIRAEAKRAWSHLRQHLLQQLVEFRRDASGEWTVAVTSWLIERVKPDQPLKITTTQQISIDEVPAEARKAWLDRRQATHSVDVTELRDQELSDY